MTAPRPEKPAQALVAADADGFRFAMLALERGELIAFPTDTVYALACVPTQRRAVARFYEAKRRPPDQPAILLSHNLGTLQHWVRFTPRAVRLAEAHWPGPLTQVLPLNHRALARMPVAERAALEAIAREGTVGVRIPNHAVAYDVLWAWGLPLCTSSANRAGEPAPRTGAEVAAALGADVSVVLDGECPLGVASSILDLTSPKPRVLREGAIPAEELLR